MFSSFTKVLPLLGFLTALPLQALSQVPPSTPELVQLVSGTIDLGRPLAPIQVPGGVRIVEPIVGGTLFGAINATIFGGEAYPAVYKNQTLQVPQIRLYGNTTDGVPFFIQEAGIGKPASQFTRIELEIGGRYSALADEFIVAYVAPNKAGTRVAINAWQVK